MSAVWFSVDICRLLSAIDDPQVVQLRRDTELVHGVFHIVFVTERILARAGDAFPTGVGTLEAIHLTPAMHVRDLLGLDAFLTHDAQLAAVAAASGFAVQGA